MIHTYPKLFKSIPNLIFMGCLCIGVVGGMMIHNTVSGILVGCGSGFVLMAVARFIMSAIKKKPVEVPENSARE
jgi:hypothetical protein